VVRFTGVVPANFTARGLDGAMHTVTAAIFTQGMQLTVFYIPRGQDNEIFLIKIGKTAILNAHYQDEMTYMSFPGRKPL
jgi:hypothetical protein